MSLDFRPLEALEQERCAPAAGGLWVNIIRPKNMQVTMRLFHPPEKQRAASTEHIEITSLLETQSFRQPTNRVRKASSRSQGLCTSDARSCTSQTVFLMYQQEIGLAGSRIFFLHCCRGPRALNVVMQIWQYTRIATCILPNSSR